MKQRLPPTIALTDPAAAKWVGSVKHKVRSLAQQFPDLPMHRAFQLDATTVAVVSLDPSGRDSIAILSSSSSKARLIYLAVQRSPDGIIATHGVSIKDNKIAFVLDNVVSGYLGSSGGSTWVSAFYDDALSWSGTNLVYRGKPISTTVYAESACYKDGAFLVFDEVKFYQIGLGGNVISTVNAPASGYRAFGAPVGYDFPVFRTDDTHQLYIELLRPTDAAGVLAFDPYRLEVFPNTSVKYQRTDNGKASISQVGNPARNNYEETISVTKIFCAGGDSVTDTLGVGAYELVFPITTQNGMRSIVTRTDGAYIDYACSVPTSVVLVHAYRSDNDTVSATANITPPQRYEYHGDSNLASVLGDTVYVYGSSIVSSCGSSTYYAYIPITFHKKSIDRNISGTYTTNYERVVSNTIEYHVKRYFFREGGVVAETIGTIPSGYERSRTSSSYSYYGGGYDNQSEADYYFDGVYTASNVTNDFKSFAGYANGEYSSTVESSRSIIWGAGDGGAIVVFTTDYYTANVTQHTDGAVTTGSSTITSKFSVNVLIGGVVTTVYTRTPPVVTTPIGVIFPSFDYLFKDVTRSETTEGPSSVDMLGTNSDFCEDGLYVACQVRDSNDKKYILVVVNKSTKQIAYKVSDTYFNQVTAYAK